MSAVTTFALLTITAPPIRDSFTVEPSTVATSPALISAAMTIPGTTW